MYDADDTSSFVTSRILDIQVESPKGGVLIPKGVSLTMSVPPLIFTIVNPLDISDPDDASEFTYHRLSYSRPDNYLCVIVRPQQLALFSKYLAYIKFDGPPTKKDFDKEFELEMEKNWVNCLNPKELPEKPQIIHMSVRYKGSSKCEIYFKCLIYFTFKYTSFSYLLDSYFVAFK